MKIERSKNATRNIVYGVGYKIYTTIVPFCMRTIMIYFLGVEYLGLNSLFTSVLQVLNLVESGVGGAMVFSMYQPISVDDTEKICALMRLYKIYYRIIGAIVLIGGILVTPFLPYLIEGDVPSDINLYILFYLNLASTINTYWLFGYKNSLLFAHQRVDISNKISFITETVKYILQIIAIICFKNYYLYTIIIIVVQVLTNLVTAIITTRMYPIYAAKGKLALSEIRNINSKIKDLFLTKIGTVIFNSADTIVISSFLGLTTLAIYQNYFYLVTSITGILSIIYNSCTAGIGNSLVVENSDKNYQDLKKMTLFIFWIVGFCTICFLCLFQPFMTVWVTEKYMLDFTAVVLFCSYFFINGIYLLFELYKDAAGIWHEDRFRPLIVSGVNLVLNLVLVQISGIYGVLIASCIAKLFIGIPWCVHNLFTVVLKRKMSEYIKKILYYTIVIIIACVLTYAVSFHIELGGIPEIVVKLVVCCSVGNLIFWIMFRREKEYALLFELAGNVLPERVKKILIK